MELLLIRHARPRRDADGDEAFDPGLDAEGAAQAERAADLVARGAYGAVTAIVASPMRRAMETAAALASRVGLPVTTDERLVELDAGARYGLGFANFTTRAGLWTELNAGRWGDHRFDPRAFTAAVVAAIDAVVARNPSGIAAVFCHGGVISAYVAHVIGAARPFFVAPDYVSVSRVLADSDGYRELVSVNERVCAKSSV